LNGTFEDLGHGFEIWRIFPKWVSIIWYCNETNIDKTNLKASEISLWGAVSLFCVLALYFS
jgi:hypothetical protein